MNELLVSLFCILSSSPQQQEYFHLKSSDASQVDPEGY